MIRNYQDLQVWQQAMDLVVACYAASRSFPRAESFGLSSQLQRAAVSIPANIAEGRGRQHRPEFIQFLFVASGSLAELETHIQIARRLNYIDHSTETDLLNRTGEVGRLLGGLIRSLRTPKN